MLTLKILSFAALVGSVAWFIHIPDSEPAIASITALSTFVGLFIADRRQQQSTSMNQSVASSGVGIQAGGNVTMGDVSTKTTGK